MKRIYHVPERIPGDMTEEDLQIVNSVIKFAAGSRWRSYAIIRAVRYLVHYGIEGDFVECGVGRGGSALVMMKALLYAKAEPRDLYLYDTFDGMPTPEEVDQPGVRTVPSPGYKQEGWWKVPLQRTKDIIKSKTRYPRDRIHYVVGRVEETLPERAPQKIALLHLDTDWYSSTSHELQTLYPRLAQGGVLLIHDYGAWRGAKRAVDEYFSDHKRVIHLCGVDHTALVGVKQDGL